MNDHQRLRELAASLFGSQRYYTLDHALEEGRSAAEYAQDLLDLVRADSGILADALEREPEAADLLQLERILIEYCEARAQDHSCAGPLDKWL